jgi:hypothetical protein
MTTIPDTYEQSRSQFREGFNPLNKRWPGARLNSQPISNEPDLTIDWIFADAIQSKEKLLVLTTGEHGIEGYIGAAMLELFLNEYAPRLDPNTTGILFVHAINPWGMKYWKRCNSNNVDLNRNFINNADFAAFANSNPDYPRLASFLSPQNALGPIALEKARFFAETLETLVRFGPRRTREAALAGQYIQPQGIYFGGKSLQAETKVLMELYRSHLGGYAKIIHLDMHTGYGPRFQMTLVNSPLEKMNAAETTLKYGTPRVAAANPDEFYTMQGDMLDWEYSLVKNEFPATHFFAATCEFGTFGDSLLAGARSLRITIFKNRLNLFGAHRTAVDWVEPEYRELYRPSETAWFEKAVLDARQTFDGVLKAEGYF